MPLVFDNDLQINVNEYGTPIRSNCPVCRGTDNEEGYCCTACAIAWAEVQGDGPNRPYDDELGGINPYGD